ncbi:hypothetical protein [Plantibacter sp. lyk4-40-MEA-4]|uniref:aggregation-promoting factor C-terminal-like domain-containing protein n=1 Tax=Plantibacter sp. lyk4-40-MEA-4 TaxID=3040298 RepID=UPI00254C1153|nr:hypothetical protein [Plantibacter sp. lyk4-40-MEA-4]
MRKPLTALSPRSRGVSRAAALGAALVIAVSVASPAAAVTPTSFRTADYPSWDDVQAAKANESTAQAEADRIVSLLDGLRDESARLGDEAVRQGAAAGEAKAAFEAQAAVADTISAQATAAASGAASSKRQAGAVIAQMTRTGGVDPTLSLVLSGAADDDLLSKLSAISKLSETSAQDLASATAASNTATALAEQATAAETERQRLSEAAEASYETAQSASDAADAAVAEQQANRDRLYQQLAVLKNTTAAVEQAYAQSQEAIAAEEQRRNEATGGEGSTSAPPPDLAADPAGAKAYAQSAIGAYGWGSGEFQCLLQLWTRESSWRVNAYNESSGAYGIPQSLPGSKMASSGDDWRTNAATQINWGLNYIDSRYGSPCGAWAHSEATNWY